VRRALLIPLTVVVCAWAAPSQAIAAHRRAHHTATHAHPHASCPAPHTARGRSHACGETRPPRTHTVRPKPEPPVAAPQGTAHASAASAVIAQILATPCENTELRPEAANLPEVRAAVLCLVNRERASHGVGPLQSNPDLERAAEGHDQELIADDYFAHVSPSGETPVDRIRATGYLPGPSFGYVIGENLAWGTLELSTPQAIVAAWIASPGHLANILESQYADTGVAVVPTVPTALGGGQQGATYAQEFGVILG